MCWVFFLKHKSKVYDTFVKFYMIVTQFQTKPQALRSDNGTEYVNAKMKSFFDKRPYTSNNLPLHTPTKWRC